MPVPLQTEAGKRNQPSVKAADDDGLRSRRIFVTGKTTKISFLIDTGADVSVHPRSRIHGHANKTAYKLFAANGTRIATYGTTAIYLNLYLRRAFKWNFVIPNVQTPIIGVDFLHHYSCSWSRKINDSSTHQLSIVIKGICCHDRRSLH